MPLCTLGKVARDWCQYEMKFSLDLLRMFIENVESQAEESMARFAREKTKIEIAQGPGGENYAREVEVYQGLDDETWDLDGIFCDYLPSLQRQSALLTLVGYFEHELDQLCLLCRSEYSLELSLSDLSGTGIFRSTKYLKKVALIDTHKKTDTWNEITNIQKLRNILVHQNGRLTDHEGNPKKAIVDYVKATDSLAGEVNVRINSGFLSAILRTYEIYFGLLDKSISERK